MKFGFVALSFVLLMSASAHARELDLALAKNLSAKAEAFALKNNWAVTIAVVDSGGNLLYLQRDVKAYVGSIEAAQQKAKSANAFQRPTKVFEDAVTSGRTGLLAVKDVVPVDGGIPIVLDGKHVGAIGVSGARAVEDGQVAGAVLEALVQQ